MTTTEDGSPSVRTLAAAATTSTAITPAGGSSEPTARSPTQDSSRDGSNDRSSGTARRQINIPPTLVRLLQADTEDIVDEDSEDNRKPEALEIESTTSDEGYLYDETYSAEYVLNHKVGVLKPITDRVDRSL